MTPVLQACLADLEARLDPEQEERLRREWIDFSQGRFQGDIFSPRRARAISPAFEWPRVSVNAALHDPDAMLLQQYGACSQALAAGSGALLNVRCNYGTCIVPSFFGAELFEMDEELDTLPTSRPLDDPSAIQRILDAGVPDIHRGYGSQVWPMAERFLELGRAYPKIGQYVQIYHPDFQGPLDICELLWGSTIFYALYDQPERVKALLESVTQTYIALMRAWIKIVPFRAEGNTHWGLFHRGSLMLRDDSAMNLSRAMFDEFVRPYDQRLLDEFGGGAIHFCGKGQHFIASLAQMRGVYAVNLSQPELNRMETIYANTVDRGIQLIGLKREAAEHALAAGRNLRGLVQAG